VIPQLANSFLAEIAARNGRPVHSIAPDVLEVLQRYRWPGNIRELRNIMERAVALCPGPEIQLPDLPEVIATSARPPVCTHLVPACSLRFAKREIEAARITEALRKHRNNRLRAAAELGISRMTLYRKLRKYGLVDAAW
jgi:DNA-binding NtrC family response regulator